MLQKYLLSIDRGSNELKIREYAIVDKHSKNELVSSPNNNFSFLCEETYKGDIIISSISNGINSLVATIRTRNIFPIGSYAIIIAREVRALYNSSEDSSAELIFNDNDFEGC